MMDNQDRRIKIVVAHPGRQHSFRVATALKEAGLLYKYATTVYDKDTSFLMRVVKRLLNKNNLERANKRKCPSLQDEDVIQFCELGGLLLLLLIRLDKSHIISNWYSGRITNRFQRRLARFIIKENVDMVISYDTNSKVLFQLLKEKDPKTILVMDNAHPNRHYLNYDYHRYWDSCGDFAETLKACGYLVDEKTAQSFGDEIKMADYHIVASSYSKEALLFDGVKQARIFKIPYGVDSNRFINSDRSYAIGKLNVLFVGEVNQRKGIRQVLEAAKRLSSSEVVFNIVGSGADHCSYLYEPYKQYVNLWGFVSYNELLRQFRENHLFLFPTMGEGFGLVLLEAMAAGLPVITTANCGGADIVEEGINGFIVSVGSTEEIVKALAWAKEYPDKLEKMSKAARETAHQYTWEKYNRRIVDAAKQIYLSSQKV